MIFEKFDFFDFLRITLLVVDLEGEADELVGQDEDGGVGVGRGLRQPQGGAPGNFSTGSVVR